jgi:putative transposase
MLRPYGVAPIAMHTVPHRFRRIRGHDDVDFIIYHRGITMPYDSNRHHRRSIRLAGYDYTQPGTYFITICTHERKPVLCEIHGGTVSLTKIGQLVARCWLAVPRHFENVTLDAWVLMPDHMHGIIIIRNSGSPTAVEHALPTPSHRPNGTRSGSLNAIMQNFKSISTRKANQLQRTAGAPLWQRDYYERVLHDARALDSIRRYIGQNPAT